MLKNKSTALLLILSLLTLTFASCKQTPEKMREKANERLEKRGCEVEVEIDFDCQVPTLSKIFDELERNETTIRMKDGNFYALNVSDLNTNGVDYSFSSEYTLVGDNLYLKMSSGKESKLVWGAITDEEQTTLINSLFYIGGISAEDFGEVSESKVEDTLITTYSSESQNVRIILEKSLIALLSGVGDSVKAENVRMVVEIEDNEYETVTVYCDYETVISGITIPLTAEIELDFDFGERINIKAPSNANEYVEIDMSDIIN